jgi:hypothetical protein
MTPLTARPVAELPPALAGWAPSLAALTPDVVAALGPMLLRLDELVARHSAVDGPDGEPDGVDGIARRGPPERLLAAEWVLADEHPDEFLRRAVTGELLHLATARRHDPPHGAVRVLVDTGPEQLGAGRLVQLAALVVLHRRAARGGAALRLGILGEPPDRWLEGDLPELLAAWLGRRRHAPPTAADVVARFGAAVAGGSGGPAGDGDEGPGPAWLLCSPGLASALTGVPPPVPARRVLTARESGWDADGVRAVEVRLAGERLTLPVPDGPAAVRALRGEGFRRRETRGSGPAGVDGPGVLRHPTFPGAAGRLLARGDQPEELWTVGVAGPDAGRQQPRRRRFGGAVLAAGTVGPRLVVLHVSGDLAHVTVVGRRLARFDGLAFPATWLSAAAGAGDGAELAAGPIAPLVFDSGTLLCDVGGGWRRIRSDGRVLHERTVVAVAPRPVADRPMVAYAFRETLHVAGIGERPSWRPGAPVLLGHGCLATSPDGVVWSVAAPDGEERRLGVPAGEQAVGVVSLGGEPALVVRSRGGLLLRLVDAGGLTTLTEWSGGAPDVAPAVHPMLPLLAVTRDDGDVDVVDLTRRRLVIRVPARREAG